jgi:hypothetical protein
MDISLTHHRQIISPVRSPTAARWPDARRKSGWHGPTWTDRTAAFIETSRGFCASSLNNSLFQCHEPRTVSAPARLAASDQKASSRMQRVCAGPWRTDGGRDCNSAHPAAALAVDVCGTRCGRRQVPGGLDRGRRTLHFTAAVKVLSASAGLDPRRSRSQRSVESAGASPRDRTHGTR